MDSSSQLHVKSRYMRTIYSQFTSELGFCQSDFTLAIGTSYPISDWLFADSYSDVLTIEPHGQTQRVLNKSTSADDHIMMPRLDISATIQVPPV
jgi:hypothetical protein